MKSTCTCLLGSDREERGNVLVTLFLKVKLKGLNDALYKTLTLFSVNAGNGTFDCQRGEVLKPLRCCSGNEWRSDLLPHCGRDVQSVARGRGSPRGKWTNWWIFKCDFYVGKYEKVTQNCHGEQRYLTATGFLVRSWALVTVISLMHLRVSFQFPPASQGMMVLLSFPFMPLTPRSWNKLWIHHDPDQDKVINE